MYKKISKLKSSLEGLLKLAELYTQQGLFNDARAQYMQVADEFLKTGDLENAVRILQKILEMDPENAAVRVKLADVYVRLGKKSEAWQIFSAAVETMRSKGSLAGAEDVLQRMLLLDPNNAYALLIQGRILLESGDSAAAVAALQKVSDIDSNKDGLRDLLKAYLLNGQLSEAGTIAGKLLTVHNDLQGITSFTDALMQAGQYENALQVFDQHAERLLAENADKVLHTLHAIIGHVRENPDSLQKLLDLFQKAGETTHVSEVMELLAHSSVQAGNLPRARDLYQRLAQIEPQNSLHMQNYQQVVSQLGGTSNNGKLITPEEAAVLLDDLEASAPSVHQHYSDEIALSVRSALTDAELFISYNMPAKALGPLMTTLPLAPHDLRINQRLAGLYTRSAQFAEAGVCCRTLQRVYSEAEFPEEATRYGELAARYEERATTTVEAEFADLDSESLESEAVEAPTEEAFEISIKDAPVGISSIEPDNIAPGNAEPESTEQEGAESERGPQHSTSSPWPTTASKPSEFAVTEAASSDASSDEVDIPSEWDDAITIEADSVAEESAAEPTAAAGSSEPADSCKVDEALEEIRFYLAHDMAEQAAAALTKLENLAPRHPALLELRIEVEAAVRAAAAHAAAEPEVEELSVEDIPAIEVAEGVFVPADSPTATEMEASASEPVPIEPVTSEPEPVIVEASVEPEPAIAEPPSDESAIHEAPEPVAEVTVDPEPVVAQSASEPEFAIAETPVAPEPALEPKQEPTAAAKLEQPAPEAKSGVLQEMVTELESSLGETFLPQTMSHSAEVVPSAAAQPASEIAATVPPILGKLVSDLETSLGEDFLKSATVSKSQPAAPHAPPAASSDSVAVNPLAASAAAGAHSSSVSVSHVPSLAAPGTIPATASTPETSPATAPVVPTSQAIPVPQASATPVVAAPSVAAQVPGASPASQPGIDLSEMFGELKQDLEAGIPSNDDDPETHYNLGIAFREMGLIDEAISELQKACMAFDHGHPFTQILQTYTWLAHCFLEKQVPEAAVRWYDKALTAPNIDGETRMALTYELASAYEAAGDKPVALKHFLTVYGTNIDYRDVSERIRVLKS